MALVMVKSAFREAAKIKHDELWKKSVAHEKNQLVRDWLRVFFACSCIDK